MESKSQFHYVELKKGNEHANSVERDNFICLEVNIPTDGRWMERVLARADEIKSHLNLGQANTSEKRDSKTAEIDNVSGVIAEFACETILKWIYGDNEIIKPPSTSSVDQIDIKMANGKTIEVRSSCVKNGIDFAVFAAKSSGEQYFDVIGPYSNGYKPCEHSKDYYMRVLYSCDKKNFMTLLQQPTLQLFITGGATRSMMNDKSIYVNKHLLPAGGQVQKESDYRVVPLGKSLDAKQFFEIIAKENQLKILKTL